MHVWMSALLLPHRGRYVCHFFFALTWLKWFTSRGYFSSMINIETIRAESFVDWWGCERRIWLVFQEARRMAGAVLLMVVQSPGGDIYDSLWRQPSPAIPGFRFLRAFRPRSFALILLRFLSLAVSSLSTLADKGRDALRNARCNPRKTPRRRIAPS